MSSMISMGTAGIVITLVGLVEIVLLVQILRAARSFHRVEERVAHFGKVLTLLTETNEIGFSALAGEIRRSTEETRPARPSGATNRTVARALRGGRSVKDVAAESRMAEGEVMLRSYLGGHALACPCAGCAEKTDSRFDAGT